MSLDPLPPQTRYAHSGGVHIAYQVFGQGPQDLVIVPGWVSNLECFWEYPPFVEFARALASFARVILFDKRGTGLSDRVGPMPSLETRIDDLRAVMAAAGSQRAVLCGYSEGGPMCALYAASHPARVAGLVLIGSYASRAWREDAPWGRTPQSVAELNQACEARWGEPLRIEQIMASVAPDPDARRWWGRFLRQSASPAAAVALNTMNAEIDVRRVLPTIQAPTLVLHARDDAQIDVRHGRELARLIPGARWVELDGRDHVPFGEQRGRIAGEIRAFLDACAHEREPERVLTTVLLTDIVGSTERAIELGDRAWRELLQRHHALVRQALAAFRGREIDTAGDGFLAAFDGPARAVRCAARVLRELHDGLGLDVRAGVHTGECERVGEKVAGIAVHIGARVMAAAAGGEVLVSSTVKDLVAGSGLRFADRGLQPLKGIGEPWRLFAVDLASAA